MKQAILIAIGLVWSLFSPAQSLFQEYIYDAANPSTFVCWQMNTTSDSGFIFNGVINFTDGHLLKTSKTGNVEWFNSYTGVNNILDAEQTADSGYIFLGITPVPSNNKVVVKTDAQGNVQWAKARNASAWPGGCVHVLPDGYIISGVPNLTLCKMDTAGNVLWEKSYGLTVDAYNPNQLQTTPDGGFIACGALPSAGGIGLVKMDSLGNIQWQRSIATGSQHGASVRVFGTRYFLSAFGANEHTAMLTDSTGIVIWARQWPMHYSGNLSELPFIVVPNGNALICYGTRYLPTQTALLIFKFELSGNVLWSRYYIPTAANGVSDVGSCRSTFEHGLAFNMFLNSGAGVLMINMDSTFTVNCNDSLANFVPTPFPIVYGTPSLVAQPLSIPYSAMSCVAIPRAATTIYGCSPLSNNDGLSRVAVRAYPNPANEKITLELPPAEKQGRVTVLDISGRIVCVVAPEEGALKTEINVDDLAPGLYLWKYETNGSIVTGKFLVQD